LDFASTGVVSDVEELSQFTHDSFGCEDDASSPGSVRPFSVPAGKLTIARAPQTVEGWRRPVKTGKKPRATATFL
jgi:hypothetical protein